MNGLKMAVIGGGSSYTPELVEGIIKRYHEFPVNELYLVDIEAGRTKLEINGALAKRMVEKAGLPITIKTTLDRREAIKDADFVSTQLRVGMLDARSRDERIPLKYGLIGQETTGAGGFAKALRTVPVILGICRDMEELAPNAFLINFTNPAGLVTEAVLKHCNIKSVGLCNLPIGNRMKFANMLEVDVNRIEVEMIGINHLTWTTKVWLDGKDVTKQVTDTLINRKGQSVKNIPNFPWDGDFVRSLGALPCDYHRYYYLSDQMVEDQQKKLAEGRTRADDVKKVEAELFELYKDPNLAIKPPQLQQRGGAYYSEAAMNLMSSIYNNKRDIQTINVRNNGVIPCLPNDVSVEVNCVIGSEGGIPVQLQSEISPQIRGLLQVVKTYEELAVEAAVTGDYGVALQALTIHPIVGSAKLAKQVLDDILQANKEYLPQFHTLGVTKC